MEQRAAEARYAALHEDAPYHDGTFEFWSSDRTADTPYRYDEGVDIVVTTENHEGSGDFLKRKYPGLDDD